MIWGFIAGAAISVVGSVIAGNKQASAARKQAQAHNDGVDRQYGYDMEAWEMNKDRLRQQHSYVTESINVKKRNEDRIANYQDDLQKQRYNYDLMIRDREQASLDAQFLKSSDLYHGQTSLNARTAHNARTAELQKYEELQQEIAFENNDLLIDTIMAEGQVRARGQGGRSTSKLVQSIMADKGRNQAKMAETLLSGARNARSALGEINLDRESADLAAYAQKMLDPGELPGPLKPLPIPRAEFLYPAAPQDYDFGPEPIPGAYASMSAASDLGWATTMSGIAGTAGSLTAAALSNPKLATSDIELKENIEQVGVSPSGLNIYEWNYIGESTSNRYRGVIAQDLLSKQRYDAVAEMDNGYLGVDYNKVDVQFTKIKNGTRTVPV